MTRAELRLGLIGTGIALSRTPAMHMAEGRAQGIATRYDLIDPDRMETPPPLTSLLDRAETEGYAGLNITYPYKQEVLSHLHHLSPAAAAIGAANTVVFRDGQRFGHNSDAWGFAEAMRKTMPDIRLDRVLLIGAGGAGSAVAHALTSLGVGQLLITDRDMPRALALAAATGAGALAGSEITPNMADGVVNATPVGMAKLPGMPMDPALLAPAQWVVDIIYFPLETAFLRAARARGCRVTNGRAMAVYQAVRAFELFTGQVAQAGRMQAVFDAFDR
ncbi:shikimate dehydrogenase [Ruegeria pomeroyi]|uniref:Shikimate dehydrogenase (NADP(+)) n=2 Tax=Ruegeria pomeroyi TaxID=89184 RepID=Q5LQR3_RUEPO|nr:shikimate dehydrogenase [Ruegeria pomeroyi]AAV95679.1 shikimate 5-dehydrogenase/quinate 5-dehydrogenase family protein [Ruegeria pomeroyi DSS-3]NVK98999.1 shikimate dehydrogenase [Ruegeria pomeroyi]NVL03041.1 shikimate dehydrogenase [Ruegeria pomeroyi]QWV09265.1 shikimate dehydrogenase [Ruegeria pomeroyi]